jgi:SagB-type dehydrogenase family enzyme
VSFEIEISAFKMGKIMGKNIGEDFQAETKYFRDKRLGGNLDWANKPEVYKYYPSSKSIQLPNNLREAKISFSAVLQKRRSTRTFSGELLRMVDLAFLLWASTGIQRIEHGYAFRTAPSAGALYPIETYIVANNVEDLDKGIYHYNIENHMLEEIKLGDFGETLAHAALDQEMCADSAVVFIWTAVFKRSIWKYSQRAYRYVYLDAGHIAQNLALAATSINCGSCHIGAFFDDEINSIVAIDGKEESTICLSVVGHLK